MRKVFGKAPGGIGGKGAVGLGTRGRTSGFGGAPMGGMPSVGAMGAGAGLGSMPGAMKKGGSVKRSVDHGMPAHEFARKHGGRSVAANRHAKGGYCGSGVK